MFRTVVQSLGDMGNPEKQFLRLLEMQLSRHEPNFQVYNFFIWYKPNRWSYETVAHGFYKYGRTTDASLWVEEMDRQKEDTRLLQNHITGTRNL